MPLLLIDLDNTLVDRSAAFRRWAETFCEKHASGDDEAVAWLAHADADGYEPRDRLAQSVRERFRLSHAAHAQLLNDLRWGMADFLELDPRVPAALRNARSAGWVTVVVTNGTVEQQERKLRVTGLDEEVDAWVISGGVGVKKPDPEIFRIASHAARVPLDGAWVVGDSARADIAGAHDLSLRSAWLHRGRPWEVQDFAPTLMVEDCASAIAVVTTSIQ